MRKQLFSMKQVLCLLAFVIVLTACKKGNDNSSGNNDNNLYGRFAGTFSRSGMDTVDVSFLFKNDNTYEASGGHLNYPALCSGTFQLNSNNLVVNDTCAWVANFDWTLIFDGNYTVTFIDKNKVRIWRTSGAVTDEYLIGRLTR